MPETPTQPSQARLTAFDASVRIQEQLAASGHGYNASNVVACAQIFEAYLTAPVEEKA